MPYIREPHLQEYIQRFLYDVFHPDSVISGGDVPLADCPTFSGRVSVHHSATSFYYAPSDVCGIGGMHRELIRAAPTWYGGPGRYDTIFITKDQDQDGFRGLHVVRVRLFFSFSYAGVVYPCALVEWFVPQDIRPCGLTGMWVVEPGMARGRRIMSVVHTDTILRGAHLIGVYGDQPLPRQFSFQKTLTAFHSYYVNKYIDHHSHEIAY